MVCAANVRFPFAEFRFRGRYRGLSGHDLLGRICPLMTQSGHPPARYAQRIELPIIDPIQIFAAVRDQFDLAQCHRRSKMRKIMLLLPIEGLWCGPSEFAIRRCSNRSDQRAAAKLSVCVG